MANNRSEFTIEEIEALSLEIQGMKATVTEVTARVNTMIDTMSTMEKTIRLILIANWDGLAAFRGQPSPGIPSPPRGDESALEGGP